MIQKCKFCNYRGELDECGFEETRRYQCPKCNAYMMPWRLRLFGDIVPKLAITEIEIKKQN